MLNQQVYQYIESVSASEKKEKKYIGLKMERLKMPSFDGNIRKYSKFKTDFIKQVEVQVKSNENLSYIPKSCLCGEALIAVESIDDCKEIWRRSEKKYGQHSFIIDILMNEIKRIPSVKENDRNSFAQFVNIVERGYHTHPEMTLGLQKIAISSLFVF